MVLFFICLFVLLCPDSCDSLPMSLILWPAPAFLCKVHIIKRCSDLKLLPLKNVLVPTKLRLVKYKIEATQHLTVALFCCVV